MRLYALGKKFLIFAFQSDKNKNYLYKKFDQKVPNENFLYLPPLPRRIFFRKRGKSRAHLQVQLYLKSLIPDLILEKKISGRIADLCWAKEKIIFEIQLSPISLQEARNRSVDYQTKGYSPVWILHDRRFNRRYLSPGEEYLRREVTTFFTNGGEIYDQFEICQNGKRLFKGPKLRVDLRMPIKEGLSEECIMFPYSLYFLGDLKHFLMTQSREASHYFKKLERRVRYRHRVFSWKRGYLFLISKILERVTD